MKKFLAILFSMTIAFTFCLVGCKKESKTSGNIQQEKLKITAFDITASVPAKNSDSQKSAGGTASLSSPYKTDKDKLSVSGLCVIRGKVIKSDYVLIGSTVLTKSVVKIEESFKGNLKEGETVCVRELGGFVPTNILSNAINNEKNSLNNPAPKPSSDITDERINDFKVMEKDEEVILFITPIENAPKEFEGCYDLLRMWQGKLLYNEDCGAYIPYVPAEELCTNQTSSLKMKVEEKGQDPDGIQASIYTLDEFRSFINNNK
ncbi:MAG: hypothetical protein MJ147_03210 [Clostridia bacterium]|nr:hypothetical protein [Clostridia bacterium]